MSYRTVFREMAGQFLLKTGYVYKKDSFYKYLPERQIVKKVGIQMIASNRDFRLLSGISSYVDPVGFRPALPDSLYECATVFYLYIEKQIGRRMIYGSDQGKMIEPYRDEELAEHLLNALSIYDKHLWAETEKIESISELYEFKKRVYNTTFNTEYCLDDGQMRRAIQLGYREEAMRCIEKNISEYEKRYAANVESFAKCESIMRNYGKGKVEIEKMQEECRRYVEATTAWMEKLKTYRKAIQDWNEEVLWSDLNPIIQYSKQVCEDFFKKRR